MVRSVLERVLHVKLDMESVYAADAAAAQDALQTAMRSNVADQETVRSGATVCRAHGSVRASRAPLCTAAKAMRNTGLNHNMWSTPK